MKSSATLEERIHKFKTRNTLHRKPVALYIPHKIQIQIKSSQIRAKWEDHFTDTHTTYTLILSFPHKTKSIWKAGLNEKNKSQTPNTQTQPWKSANHSTLVSTQNLSQMRTRAKTRTYQMMSTLAQWERRDETRSAIRSRTTQEMMLPEQHYWVDELSSSLTNRLARGVRGRFFRLARKSRMYSTPPHKTDSTSKQDKSSVNYWVMTVEAKARTQGDVTLDMVDFTTSVWKGE